MNISVMREFVTLAETGNFTRTAEKMYIAQSALSRHISSLEEELGVRLIERDHNYFKLTAAGEITRDEFTKILAHYERLLDRLAEPDMLEKGELHMGFLYYDRDLYVSRICSEFHRQFPLTALETVSGQPHMLEEQLFSGKLDVIFSYGASLCRREDIQTLPFLKIPYSVIFSKSHRFAGMQEIRLEDLNGEKFIVPAEKLELNGVLGKVGSVLSEHHISFSEQVPVRNFDEVSWWMSETGAIYLSPMANPGAYGADTEYRYLEPEVYSCDISTVWLKDNTNPAIPRLLTAVRKCYP